MVESNQNNHQRKDLLKSLILQLHKGQSAEAVRKQLVRLLGKIPYAMVVEAEQELIAEGLPAQEVLKLCDIHGEALKGIIDLTEAKPIPAGHPVHIFQQENIALRSELSAINRIVDDINNSADQEDVTPLWKELYAHFQNLSEVDKHYRRKENLVFPFLEKKGITGPPTVMWGKDDEIRQLLKGALQSLHAVSAVKAEDAKAVIEWSLQPAISAVEEMILKEEEILFPMCLDTLSASEWFEINQQSTEIGFCLYEPSDQWNPEDVSSDKISEEFLHKIRLQTGNVTLEELTAIFKFLPVDITFVDKEDTVKFFSDNPQRIFERNRAVLGRKVQFCHPPSSVHIVQKILDDFRSGQQSRAAFWINLHGKFIHIEYFALRDEKGEYLGTLEVTQDITHLRELQGEQRLLTYTDKK